MPAVIDPSAVDPSAVALPAVDLPAGALPAPAGESWRDRKREETVRALAHAAYDIVRDHGIGAVTAEAVAERAGVSRRTFFNYFPSVESVLTASVARFFTSLGERLDSRPDTEPVLASVLAVIADPADVELVERIGVLATAADASAQARGLILVELHGWLDWFEEWLRRRLGPGRDELFVATLASGLLAAGEAAMRVWSRHAADPAYAGPTFTQHLAAALDQLRAGLDPDSPAD
ncbi:MAG: TetR family transcriptional regulator [Nocardioides sp.]